MHWKPGAAELDLLVVGATGQDGTFVLDQASDRGLAVAGTSRSGGAGLFQLDPSDREDFSILCDCLTPKRIIMLAAQSSVGVSFADPVATWHANTLPVLAACEWIRCKSPATRLVFAASGECFGSRSIDRPAREDDAFRPANPYGAAKAAAASMVRGYREAYGLALSIAFLFNHESSQRDERFVFGKVLAGIRRLKAGGIDRIRLGDLSAIRDWGYAPDYADAMLRMTDLVEPADLVLATGHSVSLRSAIESLLEAAGLSFGEAIDEGNRQLSHHRRGDDQYADPALARRLIGWTGSTPFPELAQKLLAYPA